MNTSGQGSAPEQTAPKGIVIFGVLIVVSSLVHMGKLAGDLRWYDKIFSYMPPWLMALRYCFSWMLRFVGLAAGFGILRRREWSRRVLLAIAVFTIITVYWKHPLIGFKLHAQYLDRQYADFFIKNGVQRDLFASLATVSMVTNIVWEVVFNGVLMYYFTRTAVTRWFVTREPRVTSDEGRCNESPKV